MLLSIVCGGLSQDDPSVVYEYILNSLTVSRKRESGSSRHDPDFKVQVVTHYRSHPELSLEDCAKQFDISPQTLSAWQKKLIDDGIIRA